MYDTPLKARKALVLHIDLDVSDYRSVILRMQRKNERTSD